MPAIPIPYQIPDQEREVADAIQITYFAIEGCHGGIPVGGRPAPGAQLSRVWMRARFGKARPDLTDPMFGGIVSVVDCYGPEVVIFNGETIGEIYSSLLASVQAEAITEVQMNTAMLRIAGIAGQLFDDETVELLGLYLAARGVTLTPPVRRAT